MIKIKNNFCKSILLIIYLIGFCTTAICQSQCTLSGKVNNIDGKPVVFANIIAISKETNHLFNYCVTDENGFFELQLQQDSTYQIKVSCIGLIAHKEEIKIHHNTSKNIILKNDEKLLNEVSVVHKLPIKISGDTISFKVSAFTNGKERKLKDIVKKIPGFEIDKEGNVSVKGKKVNNITVDGKEFFTGDTKLAMNNIPALAVDELDVFQKENKLSSLNSFGDRENTVLNIKLKEGKKNIVFGTAEIGKGFRNKNELHSSLFYFNPKFNINLITDYNDFGKQVFTFKDYFRLNGGFKNTGNKSGSSMKLTSDGLGLSTLEKNQALKSKSRLGALSYSYNPSSKMSFSGFAIISKPDIRISSDESKIYLTDGNNLEELNSDTHKDNMFGIFRFNGKYTHNPNTFLEYNSFFKTTRIDELNILNSIYQNNSKNIHTHITKKPVLFKQSINGFIKNGERHYYSFNFIHQWDNNDDKFNKNNQLEYNSIDYLTQDLNTHSNIFNGSVNYYYIVNNNSHINFSLGANIYHQSLSSVLHESEPLDDFSVNENYSENNISYNVNNYYSGVNYVIKIQKVIMSAGFNFHYFKMRNRQFGNKVQSRKNLITPAFKLEYKMKKLRILSLNYHTKSEVVNVQNLAEGKIYRTYNSTFTGSSELDNPLIHNVNLSYYDFNTFNFSNIYAIINYSRIYDAISNSSMYSGIDLNSIPVNISDPSERLHGSLSFEKRFRKIIYKFFTDQSYYKYQSISNNNQIKNQSFNSNYKTSLKTSLSNKLDFEIGGEISNSNYKSQLTNEQKYFTQGIFANIELNFLKNFTFLMDYKYEFFKNKTEHTHNRYNLLNGKLLYTPKKYNWSVKCTAGNLLGVNSINKDSYSNILISTRKYYIQPRYIVFTIAYDF